MGGANDSKSSHLNSNNYNVYIYEPIQYALFEC